MKKIIFSILVTVFVVGCGGGDSSTPLVEDPLVGDPLIEDPLIEDPPETVEPDLEPLPDPGPLPLPTSGAPSLPPPPAELQLPVDFDMSGTCSVTAPEAATSSGGDSEHPDNAIDGNMESRYESQHGVDDAWIQFDFGAKTQLGYMKLEWENAHGEEYMLQVSDDDENWYHLRYVVGGQGETEEFFNLNSSVRYVRLQGVKRSTQYGYSIFEVEFNSPCNDNSLAALDVSSVPFPANGDNLASTPAEQEPLEIVKFSLSDGTLVTRFGVMGRSRHARERGEAWGEIGYGNNETYENDGVTPRDRGPGAHLNFVKNYFKNRTWGMEIIDNSLVAGVTKPTLRVNQYFQQAQLAGGSSFFRGFDNPGVTGFGWMSPGKLVDSSLYGTNEADCPVIPMPPNGALLNQLVSGEPLSGLNDGCSKTVEQYNGHSALSYDENNILARSSDVPGATEFWDFAVKDGVPVSGTNVNSRPLKVGDAIESSPSFFSTDEAMIAADPDGEDGTGGKRYYTNEWTYVVGVGLRPWYGRQPRLMNEPLPDEALQGGLGSISYDYADNAEFIFQQPHNNIGMQNMQRFTEGRRWLHTNVWNGEHNEDGNDRNDDGMFLQGPQFNQSSCFACHINNGRGMAPVVRNQQLDTMAVRTAMVETDSNGQQLPHPVYGQAVQMRGRSVTTGVAENWGRGVWVSGFDVETVTLDDGTQVELSKPTVAFEGPTPEIYSLRSAQPLIGMGLLEALSDAEILSRVRTTPDEDGVMGRANYAYDPETGDVRLGRYGWKASKVSLRHQAAGAALLDMSVTSPVYPNRACLAGTANCNVSFGVEAGLSEEALTSITRYLGLLGVPAQRSIASGFPIGVAPLPYLDVNSTQVAAGGELFKDIRCSTCHTTDMTTGAGTELDENRNQSIKPYTDMLLHDMGSDLADNFVEGQATGSMWRTSALWGIGYTKMVAGNTPVGYLHDSRARTLTEAIMWHGGEGTASRDRFADLDKTDRDDLLAFLDSL